MLKPTIKPNEPVFIPEDKVFQSSVDGVTGSVVTAIPEELPPTRSFDLENLLRAGFTFQPVTSFVKSSIEDNMATIESIAQKIDDNELMP